MNKYLQKRLVTSVQNLITKLRTYGNINRKQGSRRPRTVGITERIEEVRTLICIQEGTLGTSLSIS